ncbi:hypothetical protein [Tepidiforma sp.]|uniref:hypothetical protein n=1 Tax=Tepidiforma sp. TaxID=2682230 RepID=UPI002ADE53BE|nr:hypothetical protein [Tepidiforma sp.]
MTQPSRVIYLPPGVAAIPPAPVVSNGAPFDRNFFESVLPKAIQGFCAQVNCEVPVVELTTIDGVTHYVNGISGVADQWVALHTSSPDHDHPTQVFIPYQTIFRVEIHPEHDVRRHRLGFVTEAARQDATAPTARTVRRAAASTDPGR